MLKFKREWRFASPGPIGENVVDAFSQLIGKVASQGDRQDILEHFKSYFASAAGSSSSWSSSVSWAESDLYRDMRSAGENAPLFIEALYEACEQLQRSHPDYAVPDVAMINRVLAEHNAGYQLNPPELISHNSQHVIEVPPQAPSLESEAKALIQQSLEQSERLLAEGRDRQAVQEVLWLLETVTTAFQGLEIGSGTVQGKYFNKIAEDMRKHNKGKILDQVLGWVAALHGYLSSPTGGGIRHGTDLKAGTIIQPNEARLFCNLIRSYISYLMAEHARLTGTPSSRGNALEINSF